MDCGDVSADVNTTGEVFVGQVNESIFEVCDTELSSIDIDWFQATLEYGRTYLFYLSFEDTPPGIQPTINLMDRSGNEISAWDDKGELHVRYTAQYSGRFYAEATQGSLLYQTPYSITVVEITDDNKSIGPPIGLRDGWGKLDGIEEVGDTDLFNFEVYAGRDYRFIVVGEDGGYTLSSPSLELSRDGVTIGSGDQFIGYSSELRETLQLTVGGNMGTGTYQVIGLVADDIAADASTTSILEFDADGLATKSAYISQFTDIDWHRVSLNEGDIIRVTLTGTDVDYLATPNLILRDSELNVVFSQGVRVPSDDAKVETYYHVETTGDYFAVARTKLDNYNGAYEISVEKTRTPIESNDLFGRGPTSRLLLETPANIPVADLVDLKGLTPFAYEVYSSVPLNRNGTTMAANKTYGIINSEIGLWSVDPSLATEPGDLMVRAVVSGDWSEWKKFETTPASVPDGVVSSSLWEGTEPITYRFVTSQPSYYAAGEFGEFVPMPEFSGIGASITDVFDDFTKITGREIVAAADGVEADMNIFAGTEVGMPFLSYLPAPLQGGDMIFNFADLPSGAPNTLQQFRMVRAIGPALGLEFNLLPQIESAMGSQNHPDAILPQNFGAIDWLALRESYGSALLDPDDVQSDFVNYDLSSELTISTIGFEGRNIVVDVGSASEGFMIDLRDGKSSYAREEGVISSEVVVAYGAQILNGIGGDGDDFIHGNGLANVLQGGPGSDFLVGHENDDTMIGGVGDDVFIHYFGDGNDLITDADGIDTLCFFGRGPFEIDDLTNDYLFTRNGNFLDIELTLDGGPSEGSVRIDTGQFGVGIVESLELWQGDQFRQRISLFDLWGQLSDRETSRFMVTGEADNFGNLVVPV